ncbi:Uu.00g070790.m01.CDS01 [Anthostomella pinea]|uniref:Uu.00g070790.m01.CDS01 n=1 Tax=Anthostomella pinea TaxID=933095 RepID=A0AAI8VUS2_9PEZI|nr:Uu.00g070790.m01.CDS01 [Anthostomella pinea]
MPLHLLGKKSWNVYNADNIVRVQRDEAAAAAREEAEEQRQQEVDAERRLALLRGEVPPPLPAAANEAKSDTENRQRDRDGSARDWDRGRERRKRKRTGEDDTDFELRLARERAVAGAAPSENDRNALAKKESSRNAPLIDHAGHFSLFPEEQAPPLSHKHAQKNEEAEKDNEKKRREYEDQYRMRFSNAAGRDSSSSLTGPAWYEKGGDIQALVDGNAAALVPAKDVWGNEDPRRKEREAKRVVSKDPLAMMKRGAAKVREVEKERKVLNAERERELKLLRKEEKRREKRRRRDGRADHVNELEGFRLDGPPPDSDRGGKEDKSRSRDRRRDNERHSSHKEKSEHKSRHRSDSKQQSSKRDSEAGHSDLSRSDRRRSAKTDNY